MWQFVFIFLMGWYGVGMEVSNIGKTEKTHRTGVQEKRSLLVSVVIEAIEHAESTLVGHPY